MLPRTQKRSWARCPPGSLSGFLLFSCFCHLLMVLGLFPDQGKTPRLGIYSCLTIISWRVALWPGGEKEKVSYVSGKVSRLVVGIFNACEHVCMFLCFGIFSCHGSAEREKRPRNQAANKTGQQKAQGPKQPEHQQPTTPQDRQGPTNPRIRSRKNCSCSVLGSAPACILLFG